MTLRKIRRFILGEPIDKTHPDFDPARHIDFVDEVNAALESVQAGQVILPDEVVQEGDAVTRLTGTTPGKILKVGPGGALVEADAPAGKLAELTDVDVAGGQTGQAIVYDQGTGRFQLATVAVDLSAYASKTEVNSTVSGAVQTHAQATDPHPQYMLEGEVQSLLTARPPEGGLQAKLTRTAQGTSGPATVAGLPGGWTLRAASGAAGSGSVTLAGAEVVSVLDDRGAVACAALMNPGDAFTFSRAAPPSYARVACVAALGASEGGMNSQNISGRGFNTLYVQAVTDTHGAFNNSTFTFTAPRPGLYQITTKFRLSDTTPAGVSYGQGANTQNTDGPHFLWNTTASGSYSGSSRQGSVNVRLMQLAAGEQVRAYAYVDLSGSVAVAGAEMTIILIGESGAGAGAGYLSELLDVADTAPQAGQGLVFDGAAYAPRAVLTAAQRGVPGGVPSLDENGKVPADQLPAMQAASGGGGEGGGGGGASAVTQLTDVRLAGISDGQTLIYQGGLFVPGERGYAGRGRFMRPLTVSNSGNGATSGVVVTATVTLTPALPSGADLRVRRFDPVGNAVGGLVPHLILSATNGADGAVTFRLALMTTAALAAGGSETFMLVYGDPTATPPLLTQAEYAALSNPPVTGASTVALETVQDNTLAFAPNPADGTELFGTRDDSGAWMPAPGGSVVWNGNTYAQLGHGSNGYLGFTTADAGTPGGLTSPDFLGWFNNDLMETSRKEYVLADGAAWYIQGYRYGNGSEFYKISIRYIRPKNTWVLTLLDFNSPGGSLTRTITIRRGTVTSTFNFTESPALGNPNSHLAFVVRPQQYAELSAALGAEQVASGFVPSLDTRLRDLARDAVLAALGGPQLASRLTTQATVQAQVGTPATGALNTGPGYHLRAVVLGAAARVRLYRSPEARDADLARPSGDPAPAGLIWEGTGSAPGERLTVGRLAWVDGASLNDTPFTVDAAANGPVTVTAEYLPVEARPTDPARPLAPTPDAASVDAVWFMGE